MERAVLLKAGNTIEPSDLALTAPSSNSASDSNSADGILAINLSKGIVLDELERSIIENVLGRTGWNRTKAAHLLGLSRERCAIGSKNIISKRRLRLSGLKRLS